MNESYTYWKDFTWYHCPFNLTQHYYSWHLADLAISYLFLVYTSLPESLLIFYHLPKILKLYFKEEKERHSNSIPTELHGYREGGMFGGKKCQTSQFQVRSALVDVLL